MTMIVSHSLSSEVHTKNTLCSTDLLMCPGACYELKNASSGEWDKD